LIEGALQVGGGNSANNVAAFVADEVGDIGRNDAVQGSRSILDLRNPSAEELYR
jgi:hypothetical protein